MKTAAEMVVLIQDALSSSPGIQEITVDGIRIKLDKGALEFWERRAAREAVPVERPIAASIDLS